MASSTEFVTTMASFYASSLRSGLAYNFAYDLALANTAKHYNFSCMPNVQELKLRLKLNPNGCYDQPSTAIGSVLQSNPSYRYPPEIVRLIAILGPEITEQRLTELFVSALDGTLIQNGMNESSVNSIVNKILGYLNRGCITARLSCECDNATQDPCRVVSSMRVSKNVRYALPQQVADELTNRVETLLHTISGDTYDLENLTVREINEIQKTFEDTLRILYNNNQTSVDPDSGQNSAIIDDFFDQAKQRFPGTNDPIGFDGGDFTVLLSLLNSNGQFPRIASIYSRLMNRLSNKLGRLVNVSTQNNSFSITPDYSANSVLFSSLIQFESNNVSCDPNKYPISSPDSNIVITCECLDVQPKRCSISFLANVVTKPMIYEVPYFYASGRAVAELPTPPDIQFIPYKDVDNTLLINLNTTAGMYTTKFVPITMEDEEYLSRLASSRGVATDSLFDFEGDPEVQYYEAFRIDFHPTTYKDFALAEMYTFQNYRGGPDRFRNRSVFRDVDIKAYSNGISQEHSFIPNKKYYYIFRTIDINDNISNPSKVFEVEIVNNGGAIFPIIRTVDFLKPKVLNDKAEMRRLMLLTPARSQTDILSISTEMVEDLGFSSAADAIRNLKLSSAAENTIWDKRFKVRFTSLDTGRMLDLNIIPTVRIVDPTNFCGPKPIVITPFPPIPPPPLVV